MKSFLLPFIGTVGLVLAVSKCSADESTVTFTTDKSAVAQCVYIGRIDNHWAMLTIGANDDMLIHNARKVGADTILRRGKFDSQGEGFRCNRGK